MASSHSMSPSGHTTTTNTKSIQSKFVIVGGGIAGVSCLEALAIWDEEASIVLVTEAPVVKAATKAVTITKTLTQLEVGFVNVDDLESKYKGLQVITDRVVGFNAGERTVTTSRGLVVTYDKLCICTGATPKLIQEGNPHVIGIRDTDSVLTFSDKVQNARRIVVVGNGGIASEVVYEVRGVDKVWVVKDDHISKAFVDAGAAEFFQSSLVRSEEEGMSVVKRVRYTGSDGANGPALGPDWHAQFHLHGAGLDGEVTIEYETFVDRVEPGQDNFPVRVCLTNNKHYDCDLVVSATGVTPNVGPFSCLQREPDGGITVDWKLETSVPGVFAAGDVCSAAWPWAQHWLQMRLWTQARQMGMYAAQCMATPTPQQLLQDFCFEIFSHVTKFFGYKVVLLGLFNAQKLGTAYELLVRVTKGREYVKLVLSGGRLQGCVLIGDTDLEEMCENLILNQLDLSVYGEDLLNPDIDIEDYFD